MHVRNTHLLSAFFIQLIVSFTPIVANVGLWFVKSPEPFTAPLRDDVVFDCSLNVQAETIRWRHGRKFITQNRTTPSRSSGNNQLIIKLENESQLGDYQCVAWYGASALASVPARLSLAEIKPFAHQPEKRYQVTVGNMVVIFCPPPVSNPPAVMDYMHNDRKLVLPHVIILPTSNSLLLPNVTLQDSGIYTCSATNYFTQTTLPSPFRVILNVVSNHEMMPSAPQFLFAPQNNYVVQSGTNVTIECVAVGEPPPKVSWHKEDDPHWLRNNRTDLIPGGLFIRNVVPDDRGVYVCKNENGISPALLHKVLLQVQEAPVVLREPDRTVVDEDGSAELTCEFSGNPIPTVSWTLNGEYLQNDTHFAISSSTIAIRRAQKKHAGIYQCFATNSVGTTYGTAMLQVSPKQMMSDVYEIEEEFSTDWAESSRSGGNRTGGGTNRNRGHNHGKKEHQRKNKSKRKHKENEIMVPPTRPNVTRLSDRSVMVRWHVPMNNGLPISFFKVQYREVSGNETSGKRSGGGRWMTSNEDIPPHIRSYEVDRLDTNRYYKFRVAAVYTNNDNKLSPNSQKFFLHQGLPTEHNRLSPPSFLVAEALSPTCIRIEWKYSNPMLTPVDGFYVYYRATSNAGDYVKATVEGEETRAFNITHLMPDTAYDIKIQSFTIGAASDFSTIVSRKTLVDPTSTTTESTSRNDLKSPNVGVLSATSSSNGQLLIVFAGIVLFLIVLCIGMLICFLRQRSLSDRTDEEETSPDKNAHNMTIHQMEPVTMNGFAHHNNKMMNGSVKSCGRNGYITPHTHINITNNPLATEAKHEKNMMEMTYLSKYNNNCTTIDRCGVDSDSDCSREVNKWKLREQRPGEKYV